MDLGRLVYLGRKGKVEPQFASSPRDYHQEDERMSGQDQKASLLGEMSLLKEQVGYLGLGLWV